MCRRCETQFEKLDEEERKAFIGVDFQSFPYATLFIDLEDGRVYKMTIHYCPFCGKKFR